MLYEIDKHQNILLLPTPTRQQTPSQFIVIENQTISTIYNGFLSSYVSFLQHLGNQIHSIDFKILSPHKMVNSKVGVTFKKNRTSSKSIDFCLRSLIIPFKRHIKQEDDVAHCSGLIGT